MYFAENWMDFLPTKNADELEDEWLYYIGYYIMFGTSRYLN